MEKPACADDLEAGGNHACRLAGKGCVHDAGSRRKFPNRKECHHRDGGNESTVVEHTVSQIRNPKSQIGLSNLRSRNFGFEMQDSSNFKILLLPLSEGIPEFAFDTR